MANNAYTQQALAADPQFQRRIASALSNVAFQVMNEPSITLHHAERVAYATRVINNVDAIARSVATWFVMRTNVFAFATSYDFAASSVVSAAGDPDLESQFATDWNILSGVIS